MYEVTTFSHGYYVIDSKGNITESFDPNEYHEACEMANKLNSKLVENNVERKMFDVRYLKARSRWITNKGQKLQVPAEEFNPYFESVIATSAKEAIDKIHRQYGYIVADVQIV